jgi:phosphatidylglycerophosphate synthase
MPETAKNKEDSGAGTFKSKAPSEFLNYFGRDRRLHLWLQDKRTTVTSAIFPPFVRIGLVPDTISYIGISFLAGVVLYFVRRPILAVIFLAGHVIFDGLDGAFARHTGKPSQSGAFTDLVCDQFGMVVVALAAIFHHMVSPVLGAVYIALYLIVVVFGVIINVMGLGTRITITSKYFLYTVYAIWAGWEINLFPLLMSFFSVVMAVEVIIGYLRLKGGIRRKFDTDVRFTQGDPYSGKLNYALNVAVPISVLAAILIGANWIPLRAMVEQPKLRVAWSQGPSIIPENEVGEILGLGVRDKKFLVLMRNQDGTQEIKRLPVQPGEPQESFAVPSYIAPAVTTFPVDENVLLFADSTTRLLMGVDLNASFAAKTAVIVLTLPLEHLRVTAMATGNWKGKRVWLAANYLYTRKTYVVDPQKAFKKGNLLGGVVASYTNGGYPCGMTLEEGLVIDYNKSPFQGLIYVASLKKMVAGANLLDVGKTSFAPPEVDAIGPVVEGEDLVMLSRNGTVFRLPMKTFLPKPVGDSK